MRTIRVHTPDDFLGFGVLGELPVTFTATIDSEENRFGWSHECKIMKANIELKLGDRIQTIDVSFAFLNNKWLLEEWESRILRDYKSRFRDTPDDARDRSLDGAL